MAERLRLEALSCDFGCASSSTAVPVIKRQRRFYYSLFWKILRLIFILFNFYYFYIKSNTWQKPSVLSLRLQVFSMRMWMPTSGFSEGQCGHVAKSRSQYISVRWYRWVYTVVKLWKYNIMWCTLPQKFTMCKLLLKNKFWLVGSMIFNAVRCFY